MTQIATVILTAPGKPSADEEVVTPQRVRQVMPLVEALWTLMSRGRSEVIDRGVHGPYSLPARLLPDHGACPVEAWRRWADGRLREERVGSTTLTAYVLIGAGRCEPPGSVAPVIGGGRAWFDNRFGFDLVLHELGHALGLWHSHLLPCADLTGPEVRVRLRCPRFRSGDADDPFDPMGVGTGSYSASNLLRLGWLDPREVQKADIHGRYTLAAPTSTAPGARLLRIPLGRDGAYEIEYHAGRQFRRAWPAEGGLLIRLVRPDRPESCLVVTTRLFIPRLGPIDLPPSQFEAFPESATRFEDPVEGVRLGVTPIAGGRVKVAVSQTGGLRSLGVHRHCGPDDQASGRSI